MSKFKTFQDCIDQLEKCDYECQGGSLKNNMAFMQIKELAKENNIIMPNAKKLCSNCKEFNMCRIQESCKTQGLKYCRYHIFK